MYKTLNHCRACGSTDLQPVIDFGFQPLANDFKDATEFHSGAAPLKVLFCRKCTLAQLSVVVDPSILYNHYSYVTSTSQTMLEHFTKLRQDLETERMGKLGTVLEIGSNDGRFLEFLKPNASFVLGVDPAKNLCEIAESRGISTYCQLWSSLAAASLPEFDTIIARHVFCHCDDWQDFIEALSKVSDENTVIAIEVPYAGDLLKNNEFDTIYHEHLSYLSIRAMNHLLANSDLFLSKILWYTIHGGAMLMILRKRNGNDVCVPDDDLKAESWVWLDGQAREMMQVLRKHVKYVNGMKGRTCGYGASAKSTLWMNGCGFKKHDIEFIHDTTPQKQGKLSPGTDVPIIDGRQRMTESMTHSVIFAWNFAAEIIGQEAAMRKNGLTFILPVPKLSEISPTQNCGCE